MGTQVVQEPPWMSDPRVRVAIPLTALTMMMLLILIAARRAR